MKGRMKKVLATTLAFSITLSALAPAALAAQEEEQKLELSDTVYEEVVEEEAALELAPEQAEEEAALELAPEQEDALVEEGEEEAPAPAEEAIVPGEVTPLEEVEVAGDEDLPKLEMNEVDLYKREIRAINSEVNSLPITREEQEALVQKFNETSLEMEENIEHTAVGVGFTDIYDVRSIPQRLMLLGRLGVAMRFATTQLRYKVDAAHAEIAEYIFAGLVIAASPFHTIEDMKTYMEEFEVLKQKLLGYPTIGLNDTANLYVRSDLDAKLHKARFMKYDELSNKSTAVIKALDKEISVVTRIRLRPQATVAEIYEASDRLDAAVAIAINSEDVRALATEIEDLRDLLREAKRLRRRGDKRPELGGIIDVAQKELRLIRPSGIKVKGYILTLENLLDF